MPLYEYRCAKCQRRVTLLVRAGGATLACTHCGSSELSRLFSTFAVHRTYVDNYESILTDSNLVRGLEGNDPRALAEWNHRMSRGLDQEEAEPEYQDMLERMEAGHMPPKLAEEASSPDEAEEEA